MLKLSNLEKTQLVVVTDKERGITNAIEKVAKNVIVCHCWNHIKQDFKFWLGTRGISGKEKNIYTSDLEAILESESIIEFEQKCEELLCKRSKVAVDYFNNFLKSDILQYSSRWRLTELNIYNTFSGITNNASELSSKLLLK